MKDEQNTVREIWPSAARLAATMGIFVFHFLDLFRYYQYHLDFYSILVFCFLSGYLITASGAHGRALWIIRRYVAVMIPYWSVIIPVFCANAAFKYKAANWTKILVGLAGGSMFVADPVYVISWYITFILLLYTYAVIDLSCPRRYKVVVMAAGFLIFAYAFQRVYYFIAFVAGLRLSENAAIHCAIPHRFHRSVSAALFRVQKYCYPFFLIHSAVLLFFVRETSVRPVYVFCLSFALTSVCSVLLFWFTHPLQIWATNGSARLLSHVQRASTR